MFGKVANGTLPGRKYIWGFVEIFGLQLKVLHMKTKCVSKFFISSVFTSDNQCPKYSEFLTAYIHKFTLKTIDSYNASYYIEVNSQK